MNRFSVFKLPSSPNQDLGRVKYYKTFMLPVFKHWISDLDCFFIKLKFMESKTFGSRGLGLIFLSSRTSFGCRVLKREKI